MKNRLSALDGLRGLAAFSVFINHLYINFATITTISVFQILYKAINVGHNSVQIFFVLSGFLMSSIYPVVPNAFHFIQKRYSRIFPPFIVVVLYLWITVLEKKITTWYWDAAILFLLAIAIHSFLKLGRKIPRWDIMCRVIIILFFIIQLGTIAVYVVLVPKYQFFQTFHIQNIIIMMGNLTLAFPFMNGVDRLSPVFWSLTPEILFYLLYPFLVVPLVSVGRKWGYIVTVLLIIGMTKILLDLDYEFYMLGHIYIISIATCNGFVAGVTAGTLYQNKKKAWEIISPILKNPFVSLLILFAFFFMQWGDGVINTGQSLQFTNYYFLISSWIIAFTVLTAIIPGTPVNKFFSHKILVFLGLISYSLYLIHNQTIVWVELFLGPIQQFIPVPRLFLIISYIAIIGVTLAVSYGLFFIIERLYFVKDKHVSLKTKKPVIVVPEVSFRTAIAFCMLATAFIITVYSGRFWPTLLVEHHALGSENSPQEISLLHKDLSIPFYSRHSNLEMITLDMQYKNNADFTKRQKKTPANLVFQLYDQKNHLIFTSTRHAYDIEGERHFPLGFPSFTDSANKMFTMKLSLKDGDKTDYIVVDNNPMSLVSIYAKPHANPVISLFTIMVNRFLFAIENINALFALFFVWIVTGLMVSRYIMIRMNSILFHKLSFAKALFKRLE